MEDENNVKSRVESLVFLQFQDVQEHFADLNIELLRGKHVLKSSHYSFQLLRDYEKELIYYYQTFYRLDLVKETKESIIYYYLDYNTDNRGTLSDQTRHKELSQHQTLVGIILLNMYYERYFENNKEIRFEDLKKEIKDSENSELYKKLFFDEVREDYIESDWKLRVIQPFKRVLRDFNKLGWIENLSLENDEEIHFRLKEPIYRFQKLYEKEIANFDQFVEQYLKQTI